MASDPEAPIGGETSGRLPVLMIFGGIVLALCVAAALATHLRAETRTRLLHPAPPASS